MTAKTPTAETPPEGPAPDETLRPALEDLAARDDDLAKAYATCGLPPVRGQRPGFDGLLRIIFGQQVSTASARAIIKRMDERLAEVTPETFLALTEAELKTIGLSRQKMRYGRALAEDLLSGRIDLQALDSLADEEAIAHLLQGLGIGRWTAEIYLLFSLKRADIWPVGDLAVCVAAQRLKGLAERPSEKAMRALGEPWRPHRSAAARFLWHFYRHEGVAL